MEQEKKLKILVVHNYYQFAGGEDSVVANEIEMLRANGQEVFLYSRDNNEINTFSWTHKLLLPFTAIFSIKSYRDVKQILKDKNIDIMHVHNTLTLVSPSVYYAAFKCGIPVVQTIHNFRMICSNALLYRDGHICEDCLKHGLKCALKNRCYRNSFAQTCISVCILMLHRMIKTYKRLHYICLTDFNKEKLLKVKQIEPNKIYVKPNFGREWNEIVPFKQRKKQFVFVGRPEKVKGIYVLLDAWKTIEGYDLLVCGNSKEMDACKTYIEKHKIENVYMLGYIENRTVKKIISESIALIFPTQWYEGFPMGIVEALSSGTQIIGSNIGNVGCLVEKEGVGYTFQFDSADDLAVKIQDSLKTDRVEQCLEKYRMLFTEANNYEALYDIYMKALQDA